MARETEQENYIVDENPEIAYAESLLIGKLKTAFPAFRHKNYRLYFFGQLISLIGTWLQTVALGWLVLELTNSAFLVGVVTALTTLPVLFFALFGGVVVDRLPKKKIIITTQTSSMILAFSLGLLTVFHVITIWEIFVIAFLSGVVTSLDNPARQAYVVEMVGKEDLSSAIALNSSLFNSARVIGPGVAGILIGLFGVGGAFILNGVSFIGVIIALFFIDAVSKIPKLSQHPIEAIKEGVQFAYGSYSMRNMLVLVAGSAIFGWSFITLMPVIAKQVFNQDATGLGFLYSANGLGAVLGAIIISIFRKKIPATRFILSGNFIFCFSLILFSFVSNYSLALLFLFFAGIGLLMQFATTNATIQHLVDHRMRGRVMSIYSFMFLGLTPFGSFEVGYLAEKIGAMNALRLNIVLVIFFGLFIFLRRAKLAEEIKNHLID